MFSWDLISDGLPEDSMIRFVELVCFDTMFPRDHLNTYASGAPVRCLVLKGVCVFTLPPILYSWYIYDKVLFLFVLHLITNFKLFLSLRLFHSLSPPLLSSLSYTALKHHERQRSSASYGPSLSRMGTIP